MIFCVANDTLIEGPFGLFTFSFNLPFQGNGGLAQGILCQAVSFGSSGDFR